MLLGKQNKLKNQSVLNRRYQNNFLDYSGTYEDVESHGSQNPGNNLIWGEIFCTKVTLGQMDTNCTC